MCYRDENWRKINKHTITTILYYVKHYSCMKYRTEIGLNVTFFAIAVDGWKQSRCQYWACQFFQYAEETTMEKRKDTSFGHAKINTLTTRWKTIVIINLSDNQLSFSHSLCVILTYMYTQYTYDTQHTYYMAESTRINAHSESIKCVFHSLCFCPASSVALFLAK